MSLDLGHVRWEFHKKKKPQIHYPQPSAQRDQSHIKPLYCFVKVAVYEGTKKKDTAHIKALHFGGRAEKLTLIQQMGEMVELVCPKPTVTLFSSLVLMKVFLRPTALLRSLSTLGTLTTWKSEWEVWKVQSNSSHRRKCHGEATNKSK